MASRWPNAWGMTEALGAAKATLPPGLAAAAATTRIEHKLRSGSDRIRTELRIVDDDGGVLPRMARPSVTCRLAATLSLPLI